MKQETENRQQRPQMICLCATCANAFYKPRRRIGYAGQKGASRGR